ncbi:MAG: hypothetical protein ACHQ1D_01550 [Nitrososphaerales archaeon]
MDLSKYEKFRVKVPHGDSDYNFYEFPTKFVCVLREYQKYRDRYYEGAGWNDLQFIGQLGEESILEKLDYYASQKRIYKRFMPP